MIKKLCCHMGCPRTRLEGHRYCEKHLDDEDKDNERYTEYLKNKYTQQGSRLPEDKQAFYNTSRWRKMRRDFLKENPYCVYCGSLADQVHHDFPEKYNYYNEEEFYDVSHLVSVCAECHRRIRK